MSPEGEMKAFIYILHEEEEEEEEDMALPEHLPLLLPLPLPVPPAAGWCGAGACHYLKVIIVSDGAR